jgi:hypothetical protein
MPASIDALSPMTTASVAPSRRLGPPCAFPSRRYRSRPDGICRIRFLDADTGVDR